MELNLRIFWIFIQILALNLFADNEVLILTPYHENISIAKLNGNVIKEYDVFGNPSSFREKRKTTLEDRSKVINDYVFERILQIEGNVPGVLNSEDYKKNYNDLLYKNAVDHLRQTLINDRFINKKAIDGHYKTNVKKFNLNGKRSDELIISDLKRLKEKEIKEYIKSYLDQIKKDNKLEYNNDLFLKVSEIKAKTIDEFCEKMKTLGLNKELIKYKEQSVPLSQLYAQVKKLKPHQMAIVYDVEVLKTMVDGNIVNSILISKAKEKGFMVNSSVIERTKDQLKYFVAKKYKEIVTSDSKFIPSKEEMLDYYIAHKDDDDLKSKRKMWVFEIFKEYNNSDIKDDNDKIKIAIDLENIRQKILKGEDFEKYAKFNPRPLSKDGELGFIFESDYAMIGKTAAKMKEGEISDLIIQEKAISVIKVTKVQEPMLYKFDYLEEKIKRILIDKKKELFLEDFRNELFKKYDVEFFSNKLQESK